MCGRIHNGIPRQAEFEKVMELNVLAWHCVCERQIAVDARLATLQEIEAMIDHARFRIVMLMLDATNVKLSKEVA